LGFGGLITATNGVLVMNPAFDTATAELVTANISEREVASMPYLCRSQVLFEKQV